MENMMPYIYGATVVGGLIIAIRRDRWFAFFLAVFIPLLGFLFALCLKKKCPFCAEYIRPEAKVCPRCCRDLKTGAKL